ncbi:protein Mpv17 isoform X3 [Vespa crabro]|uniref:protein Mpv17 isoform X3 n=1 Tax=Vespa crabro TaxID=7445 RepID=UPI001EFF79D9|nr:protein Mpv17 isoform X3 [Vespa crabro]
MRIIFKSYQKLLSKYPVRTQAVQAGILMGLGDQLAQNFVERNKFKDLDFARTGHFISIGFFIAGPATTTWYRILDKYIGSKGGVVVMKKVLCDQLLFAPSFLSILLVSIGLLQGNDIDSLKHKLKTNYFEILLNNYKYQVLLVQSVALLWNTYISYITNTGNKIQNYNTEIK